MNNIRRFKTAKEVLMFAAKLAKQGSPYRVRGMVVSWLTIV